MDFVDKLIHAVVFGLVVGAINFGLQQLDFYHQADKVKRFFIIVAVTFPVLFVINLIWPYPS